MPSSRSWSLGCGKTEPYARAVLRAGRPQDTGGQIEERVAARMERQRIVTRPDPVWYWLILDEAALARPWGGPEVMATQLGRLADAAKTPYLTIQVIPFTAGAHAGSDGAISLLSFDDGPDLAYAEGPGHGPTQRRLPTVRCALTISG